MSAVLTPRITRQPGAFELSTEAIYRLSIRQYHEMIEHGILDEDEPVELIEGWLVRKMPKYPPHIFATGAARRALERLITKGWFVNSQEPITMGSSEPEPDVSVIRGEPRLFQSQHPKPKDVGLIVEVADSSLNFDKGDKKTLYANAGIPVYWIINLVNRRVEVYQSPKTRKGKADFAMPKNYDEQDAVPVVLDGRLIGRIAVKELLPEAEPTNGRRTK